MQHCGSKIILIPFFLFFYSFIHAQWHKKDVEWSPNGLTAKNYRLIRSPKTDGDVKVGANTGSKPAMDASVLNIDGKRVLQIILSNRFDYENSWMLKSEIHNVDLLKHEQGHFDLNEIYTRKMFQQFKNFRFTNDFRNEIYTIMQAVNNELKQVQQIYEKETAYGTNKDGQSKWSDKIATELASIPSYKDQKIDQVLPSNN